MRETKQNKTDGLIKFRISPLSYDCDLDILITILITSFYNCSTNKQHQITYRTNEACKLNSTESITML